MTTLKVPHSVIEENVFYALKEDVGEGDITAELIPHDNVSLATVICRQKSVFCGLEWFEETYRQIDPEVIIDWMVNDADDLDNGQVLCTISGRSQSIITGERTALNFIQTLSATATISKIFANKVRGTNTRVLDTRKTIPGLRMAQKYAVSCGGCENHRLGLYDAFLIKENHIKACDGIQNAISEARFHNPELKVEIEVENLDELDQAISAGADRVLLDNFDIETLKRAVEVCKDKVECEASGNVTIANFTDFVNTGVDYVSIGSLTKNIIAIDMSMRFS